MLDVKFEERVPLKTQIYTIVLHGLFVGIGLGLGMGAGLVVFIAVAKMFHAFGIK